MICAFINIHRANEMINFKFINHRGEEEMGVGIGVDRQAYSSFWNSSLLSRFSGAGSKVPVLSNDLHQDEWMAMGKILLKGYADTGYFPIPIVDAIAIQAFTSSKMTDKTLVTSLINAGNVGG